jgi:hypothetical protein
LTLADEGMLILQNISNYSSNNTELIAQETWILVAPLREAKTSQSLWPLSSQYLFWNCKPNTNIFMDVWTQFPVIIKTQYIWLDNRSATEELS